MLGVPPGGTTAAHCRCHGEVVVVVEGAASEVVGAGVDDVDSAAVVEGDVVKGEVAASGVEDSELAG